MVRTEARRHPGAVLTALFVTLLWSSSWVLIRWGLDDEGLRPLTFAGLRYTSASVALALAAFLSGRTRAEVRGLGRRAWLRLVVLGLVFVALAQGAQFVAIDSQPAATSSLVLALTPLMVAGVSTLALGERPTRRQLAGTALIVLGAVSYFSGDLGFTPIGMAASLVGLAANTIAAIMGRSINRQRLASPLVVTLVSMGSGSLALIGSGLLVEGPPVISARAWVIVAWLAVVNTALAFTLWNRSLQHLTATESASINNTMLIQIGLLAWIFLAETPGPFDLIGMSTVSVGVYLAQRARRETAN